MILATIGALSQPTFTVVAEEKAYEFNVKSAPLSKALHEFARQAQLSLGTPHLSYRDGKSQSLRGRYTAREGLRRLLAQSRFTFKMLSPVSARVFAKRKSTKSIKEGPALGLLLPDEADTPLISEILVSVTRRTDILSQLPYSISVFTPQPSDQFGALGTTEVAQRTVGLHTTFRRGAQNKIIVRGISDGVFNGRAQSLVNTYVDFSRVNYNTPDPGLRLVDVERVEILRGPQSTLYGSGTLGGLFRVVSRRPNFREAELELSSSVESTNGGSVSYGFTTIINLPLVNEKIALRTSVLFQQNGGYIDDVRLGLSNVNSETYKGARIALGIKLSQTWDIALTSTFQRFRSQDSNYYIATLSPLQRDNYLQEPLDDSLLQIGATVSADFAWGDLVSATSWHRRDIDRISDASTIVPRLIQSQIVASPYSQLREIKTLTNETHLASKTGGRLEWIVGSFISKRAENMSANLIVPGQGLQGVSGPEGAVYFEQLDDTLIEIAAFGETTFFFTEKISATAGVRWFRYEDEAQSRLNDVGSSNVIVTSDENTENGFIPKLLLSVQARENLTLFGQFSKGYRLGGINLRGPRFTNDTIVPGPGENIIFLGPQGGSQFFESDFLTNYELGVKYTALNKKTSLTGSVFFSTWNNIQSLEYDPNGLPVLDNVGDADIFGVELEAQYRPSGRQELIVNGSWNTSEIKRTANQLGARVGDRLPGAPSFFASISGRQDFTLFDVDASLYVSYNYVGSARLLFDRDSEPNSQSYHQADLKLTGDIDRLQLSLFVRNLFDSRSNLFPFDNPFNLDVSPTSVQSDQVTPLRPRTVGLSLGWRF